MDLNPGGMLQADTHQTEFQLQRHQRWLHIGSWKSRHFWHNVPEIGMKQKFQVMF